MDSLEHDLETIEEAMSLFFQTMKRPQRWASVAARARVQIDRPSAGILHALMLHQGSQRCRLNDLAMQLGIEAPSVTRKTQELEQAGLIRRRPDPLDGRAIGLELTARGRNLGNKLWKAQRAGINQVLADWPAADRRRFVKLFERFSQDVTNYYQTNPKTERIAHVRHR